ncbi:hypothetical protein [Rubripirellula reticaptiva]|nr:hypothetical protein [Rubripirellula reticaptiva]
MFQKRIFLSVAITSIVTVGLIAVKGQGTVGAADSRPDESRVHVVGGLGLWDAVMPLTNSDELLLRREDRLWRLDMSGSRPPMEVLQSKLLRQAEFVFTADAGQRQWVFCNSKAASPFAIAIDGKRTAEFLIPDLAISGEQTPVIQSHVWVPHCNAAILMVAGGDKQTWPRDGNRPVYFWISLETGKVVRFPIGWDLDYFSADQRVAVFGALIEERFQPRQLRAISMVSSEAIANPPDKAIHPYVPFHWTNTQLVQPVFERNDEAMSRRRLMGLTTGGAVHALPDTLPPESHLEMAKHRGDNVGMRISDGNRYVGVPCDYSVLSITDKNRQKTIAKNVTDFSLLDQGRSVAVISPMETQQSLTEAWLLSPDVALRQDLLSGVEQPPPLPQRLAQKSYIRNRRTVLMIPGFGTGASIVLCLFTHDRWDMRSLPNPLDESITPLFWRRALLVESTGKRKLLDGFRDRDSPESFWLHNTGRLLTGATRYIDENGQEIRKIEIREYSIRD